MGRSVGSPAVKLAVWFVVPGQLERILIRRGDAAAG
jgi:hypothetical protein